MVGVLPRNRFIHSTNLRSPKNKTTSVLQALLRRPAVSPLRTALSRLTASPSISPLPLPRFSSSCQPLLLQRLLPPSRRQPLSSPIAWRSAFGGSSQNLLAHLEQGANNHPDSPLLQNAFYQALLRANMAAIVVERHQTGRYASNAATNALYQRALERIGQGDATVNASAATTASGQPSSHSHLSQEQLQTIGQAVAAHTRGANVAVNPPSGKASSAGMSKSDPLYVVVDESRWAIFLRYAKFILQLSLSTYLAFVLFMVVIDMTGLLKRVGGMTQISEAQPQQQKTRFSDVHGCDEAKEELQELVEFLKNPKSFSTLGGKLPKGVLLVGPPGTGKTLLARAVAGEAGVPFFFMSGSEFDEVYVGVGAKRIRELFNAARAKAPAIIFIDELDAVGGKRNERDSAYAKQTLNQLLTELDGFSQETGVIIIGATNFPKLLDKALTRPGRFDRHVVVPLPDVRGRMQILNYHMGKIKAETSVDASTLARQTPGFSGAELENLVNMAAVHASKQKKKVVTLLDFEWSKDRIMMGAERKSAVIQQKDRVMTAYREAGHALVALRTEGAHALYKATIMPRGHTLGVTQLLPEMDQVSQSRRQLLAMIDVAMGGKVAEELIYGVEGATSGASNDIQNATRVAYAMVTSMGFSASLGDVDFNSNYSRLSPATKEAIEREVRALVDSGRARAHAILAGHRGDLERLATALVEYEVLNLDEIQRVLRGERLDKMGIGGPDAARRAAEEVAAAGRGAPPPPAEGNVGLPGIKIPQPAPLPGAGAEGSRAADGHGGDGQGPRPGAPVSA